MKKGVEDFVVESTPVLDLKKGGVAQLTRQEGLASDQNWDSDRTEVYADADSENAVATLMGQNGERFPITTFPFVMGRGSECDLVLQGKGVSRRHAEIIFQAGRFVINDFDSLNGLKINGYKVSRVILEENDVIKLGEVQLTFKSGGDSSSTNTNQTESTKKSFFAKGKSEKTEAVRVEDDTFGPSIGKKVMTGAAALIAFALVGFAGLQFLQQQNRQTGDVVVMSGGNNATSAAPVDATPPQSAPPQNAAVEPAPAAAQAETPASDTQQTTASFDAAIDPPPSIAPPASIAAAPEPTRTPVVAAPKAETPKPKPAATPAKVAAPAAVVSSPAPAKAPDESQKARAAASEAEKLYFEGQAEAAIARLQPFISNNNVQSSVRSDVKRDFDNYNQLYTQYQAGQSAYASGNKELSFALWTEFMDRESKQFSGRRSTYSKSISARVVDEYVDLGNEAARNGDHHKAYKMWTKAVELGGNVAARIALDNANNKGMQLYRQALRLEYVNTTKARALWQEVTQLLPPGTEYHTKASAKLAWYDKWGA